MCEHVKNLCLCVELDIMNPEEHVQVAQSKAEDNNYHLDISLVKEKQMLKYKQQV